MSVGAANTAGERALAHEWFIEDPETRDLFNETETVHALAERVAVLEAALQRIEHWPYRSSISPERDLYLIKEFARTASGGTQ